LTGIFGTSAVLITDLNLLIQIVSFLILLISIFYKFQGKFKIHGSLMGLAVLLHFITFVVSMGPSFFDGIEFLTTSTDLIGVQSIWIHAIAGSIALILGIFLVIAWIFNTSNVASCVKRKRIMDITVVLWAISLIFGIVAYVSFYT
jgi:uncharacterized membrane protein YozB (DUF420 family)